MRTRKPRLILLANRDKPKVVAALRDLRPWLASRANVVAAPDIRRLDHRRALRLPRADLAIVLGGDGTLLAQARHLIDLRLPILGVNFGKLGFLAEFGLDDLKQYWDTIVNGPCRRSERLAVDVCVYNTAGEDVWVTGRRPPKPAFTSVALNDAVITAGPPYRMIELELALDPRRGQISTTPITGDGLIVATPSGSTAYNLSAGGSIVSPGVDALCITPLCPYSLAFRPIIVSGRATIGVRVKEANAGTTLVIDGQVPVRLRAGQQVIVRRHARPLVLLQHPKLDYWKTLAQKLHWAARPRSG
jgi:NAD+ kinase